MNTLTMYAPALTNVITPNLQISPRLINRQLNIIRHAVQIVEKQTGHVRNKDVAAYLGMSLDEYNRVLQYVNTYRLFNSKQEVA